MDYRKAIKVALAERDMTQSDLVRKTGYSRAYISAQLGGTLNRKSPSLDFICSVALAMDIKVSELCSLGE